MYNFPSAPNTVLSPYLIPQANTKTTHKISFSDSFGVPLVAQNLGNFGWTLSLNGVALSGTQQGSSYSYDISLGSAGKYTLVGSFVGHPYAGIFNQNITVTDAGLLVSGVYDSYNTISFFFNQATNQPGGSDKFSCSKVLTGEILSKYIYVLVFFQNFSLRSYNYY